MDVVGDNVEELFGSYQKLVNLDSYRFVHPRRIKLEPVGLGSPIMGRAGCSTGSRCAVVGYLMNLALQAVPHGNPPRGSREGLFLDR